MVGHLQIVCAPHTGKSILMQSGDGSVPWTRFRPGEFGTRLSTPNIAVHVAFF
jgi:hypothetical protein